MITKEQLEKDKWLSKNHLGPNLLWDYIIEVERLQAEIEELKAQIDDLKSFP